MSTPTNNHHDPSVVNRSRSIFAHDYPIPVAVVLIAITYVATIALPYRFAWTIDNILPYIQAHSNHIDTQADQPSLILVVLLIPIIFFFLLEYTVMRSYPPVSRAAKVLFITGIIASSVLIGFISPALPLQ